MGRRPAPLVVEYFERGAKLEDSSNRYQHTCKRCGELFPKGRIDTLTSHLLRKCPSVTQEDREWIFNQLQQTSNNTNPPFVNSTSQQEPHSGITQLNFQQQSALDTLAEVSKHHLNYSSQRVSGEETQGFRGFNDSSPEHTFIAQLKELAGPIDATSPNSNGFYPQGTEPGHQQNVNVPLVTTSGLAVSPLVQAASAANQQLESQFGLSGGLLDPQLHSMGGALPAYSNQRAVGISETAPWSSRSAEQDAFSAFVSPSKPNAGFNMAQKPTNKKVRGHFDDTRRKEVQEVRKAGACLRCRMLKKPCSGETPCSTCRNVESARLWRGKCLRTKVVDQFTLWSARLFYSRAKVEVRAAIHGLEQLALQGRIEARLFSRSDLCLTFTAERHKRSPPDSGPTSKAHVDTDEIWMLNEDDELAERVGTYAIAIADDFIGEEPKLFMKSTLKQAQILAQVEEMESAVKMADETRKQPARSCYNLQHRLVKNVTELWILTRLLTSSDRDTLQLRYIPNKPTQQQQGQDKSVENATNADARDISPSSASYRVILAQLLAAVECRCIKLYKTVINELERRLLRRQQASRFATFLSAVILLSCIERMAGLFRSFDTSEHETPDVPTETRPLEQVNGHQDSLKPPVTGATWGDVSYRISEHPHAWPLDTAPSTLWRQGPQFADLLAMLLRMRGLPPKTIQNSHGTLITAQDYSLPIHVSGRPLREQVDEQAKTAAAWLDPLELSVSELLEKRDGELPRKDDNLAEWDMRFVAKVLLP